ncbi:MAG: hypothetical protein RBU30_14350 [Polyangia bacterium]|nr:hypothetical protein [Polyangia bacterium]
MRKLLVLLSLVLFPTFAQAQWVHLGTTAVDHRAEKDTLRTQHQGAMKGIQFRVMHNDVRFIRFQVQYANGATQEMPVNAVVRAGQSSGYYDLPGRAQVIRSINFWYKTMGRRGPKAQVAVYGKAAPTPPPPPPPPPVVHKPQWVHLGTTLVDHRAEKDTLRTQHQGPMKGIQFRVAHNDVRFIRFQVQYANGARQEMPVNAVVRAGQSSGYYDLPGRAQVIRSINFWYKTMGRRGPKAQVAVYGKAAPTPPPPPPPPPVVHKPQWVHLGTTLVDHRAEKDTLRTQHQGPMKGIQFRVAHNDVRFIRFQVQYANGARQEMPVNAVVRAGQSSGYYDLPGRAQVIRSINFWYKTMNHRGPKAQVKVYGRL